jgi:hypothetical protein
VVSWAKKNPDGNRDWFIVLYFLFFDVTPYHSLFLHEEEIKEIIKIRMECA